MNLRVTLSVKSNVWLLRRKSMWGLVQVQISAVEVYFPVGRNGYLIRVHS